MKTLTKKGMTILNNKYSIGIDFGTESGRVALVDVFSGEIISTDVIEYKHGVMSHSLTYGAELPPDFALQHPQDYLDVVEQGVPNAVGKAEITSEQIVGVGVDFTSSTVILTDEELVPLCFKEKWQNEPHAYAKLWKHHGPSRENDILNALAIGTKQEFLTYYGNSISVEWMLPKCVEIAEKAPMCFEEADYIIEAGDWIVSVLTGELVRGNCFAGFKSFWNKQEGYPEEYFRKISPEMERLTSTKLSGEIKEVGTQAGQMLDNYANKLNLPKRLPVGTAIIDAHSAVIGMGAGEAGTMVMVMGTSTCHITLSDKQKAVEGISGVVEDGIVPGLFAYEAGQSAVGDLFAWFRHCMIPKEVEEKAMEANTSVFKYLESKTAALVPGETGLLALDWNNGNRSILNNPNLSGLLLGQTLQTKPEEIFMALMESTAFGAKMIMEAYKNGGIETNQIYACGGLPANNEKLVQIYADVMNKPIRVAKTPHVSAVGAAVLGSLAAGTAEGGYHSMSTAMKHMNQLDDKVFYPIQENVDQYRKLYQEYKTLSEYFGTGNNQIMKRLKENKSNKLEKV